MQKGKIYGLLYTGGSRVYYLVHPDPLKPLSWQRPNQMRFLVTYPGEQRTEMVEKGGVYQETRIYTTPFSLITDIKTTEIVLDRTTEILFDDEPKGDENEITRQTE